MNEERVIQMNEDFRFFNKECYKITKLINTLDDELMDKSYLYDLLTILRSAKNIIENLAEISSNRINDNF
jgi:hypothetical protein